ncbi:MAG TPA: GxxExxY protein [Tepidisphaeraceae bacterium]|jgi:GxxExxY protein
MALTIQSPLSPEMEKLAEVVVDCIFTVHNELRAGLLESVYETCLAWELASRGLNVTRQIVLPITYRGRRLDDALRLDLVVEGQIIIEIKAVRHMDPIFKTQLITYLRLSNLRLGFLVNFNSILIRDGITRIVN